MTTNPARFAALQKKMTAISQTYAAPHAAAVDKEARYPQEAMGALKREGMMALFIPVELGGEGLNLAEAAELCSLLAQGCGSAGMVYAMHNIVSHNLVVGAKDSAWARAFMKRVADEQLLLGSATTEVGTGGDLRSSICAVEVNGDRFKLSKKAPVISYGLQCDAIFATTRRAPDAAASDQVLVAALKDQYKLEPLGTWDAMGMRGTCSDGFVLSLEGPVGQILPMSFADIAAHSMVATAHSLWSSVWLGIAHDAVLRAQAVVRADSRKAGNTPPPTVRPLVELNLLLQQMRATIREAILRYDAAVRDPQALESLNLAVTMSNMKILTSRQATDIALEALRITGIQGYRNDTPYSVGRHLRDILSAPLQIANDRIISNLSPLALISKVDASLAGA